jgi:hypothetical protein
MTHTKRPQHENNERGSPSKEAFMAQVKKFLLDDPKDTTIKSVRISIAAELKRCGISPDSWEAKEIILRSCERGLQKIERGIPIPCPIPWIRQDCSKIIRGIRYVQEREQPPHSIKEIIDHRPDESAEVEADSEKAYLLRIAFLKLSLRDRQTLSLFIIRQLSTPQAQRELKRRGEICQLPALRQRKARAIQNLRKNYFSLATID